MPPFMRRHAAAQDAAADALLARFSELAPHKRGHVIRCPTTAPGSTGNHRRRAASGATPLLAGWPVPRHLPAPAVLFNPSQIDSEHRHCSHASAATAAASCRCLLRHR